MLKSFHLEEMNVLSSDILLAGLLLVDLPGVVTSKGHRTPRLNGMCPSYNSTCAELDSFAPFSHFTTFDNLPYVSSPSGGV